MSTRLGLGFAAAIAILLFGVGNANAVAQAPIINACVNKYTGQITIPAARLNAPQCSWDETPISWNVSAPGVCSDSSTKSYIMFPFLTNQAGFDTGFSIANTTSDPFGTTPAAGACTLNFFGAFAPAAINTGNIAAGTTYTSLVSSAAPNFQGYMVASCNFPLAHGFAFISDLGARNLAMGYLPFNICSPRVAPQ